MSNDQSFRMAGKAILILSAILLTIVIKSGIEANQILSDLQNI